MEDMQIGQLKRDALILANARRIIKKKAMTNSSLIVELFGCGMGRAIQKCIDLSLDPDGNMTSYEEMIDNLEAIIASKEDI